MVGFVDESVRCFVGGGVLYDFEDVVCGVVVKCDVGVVVFV